MKKLFFALMGILFLGTVTAQEQKHVYDQNDKLKEVYSYNEDGALTKVEFFYPSGAKKGIGHFENGKNDGVWINWDEQGNKIAHASFAQGIKTGTWLFWNAKGKLLREIKYEEGILLSAIEYDDNGNVASK